MLYDIIIIGGGVSGLYTAYNLLTKNPLLKIMILEKNNYLGGRIKTFNKKINNHNYIWEEGAGRLNDNHHLLIKLINDLNLKDNLSKISSEISFYPSHGYNTKNNIKYINKSPYIYINKIIKHSKKNKKEYLQQFTFKEYALQILNKNEVKFILDSFGYYAQLIKMNAYNAIKLFNMGMNPSLQFYHLNPGFNILIQKLEEQLQNCTILLNKNVLNIEYDIFFRVILDDICYKSKICILAIPKPDLLNFSILNSIKKELNSINYKSLCRIYSIFKKEDIWFKNIGKTTTNNNSRYIIPIDKENGLIMISYSDSKFANYWNKLYMNNEKIFIKKLKNNIYKTFHKKIENPIFTRISYWPCAIGFWKKNRDSSILSKKIIEPTKIPLFICGENYSETQGWIEGALETSLLVVNKINNL
jgi:protoporphyrinogen oxidase